MLGQIYYVTFLARIGNLKRRQTVSATRNGLAKGEEIREKADLGVLGSCSHRGRSLQPE